MAEHSMNGKTPDGQHGRGSAGGARGGAGGRGRGPARSGRPGADNRPGAPRGSRAAAGSGSRGGSSRSGQRSQDGRSGGSAGRPNRFDRFEPGAGSRDARRDDRRASGGRGAASGERRGGAGDRRGGGAQARSGGFAGKGAADRRGGAGDRRAGGPQGSSRGPSRGPSRGSRPEGGRSESREPRRFERADAPRSGFKRDGGSGKGPRGAQGGQGARPNRSFDDRKSASGRPGAPDRKQGRPGDRRSGGSHGVASPERRPRSKKMFNERSIAHLVERDVQVYRGELDPKRGLREQVAPGRRTRERRDLERDALMEQRRAERARGTGVPETEDGRVSFYPNEASPARLAALEVTRQVRVREAYAQPIIETVIDSSDMSAEDRAFATLLALGVVSTYGLLDEVIDRALDRPADAFDDVRDALRISTYEMLFLAKQAHAAIDQGVELVRAISPSAAGLGNAILHRVDRLRAEFPFGDPVRDLQALARVYAFPTWMARRLVEDLGPQDASTLMHVSNEPAPLFIAVNALRATDQEAIDAFARAGATLRPAEAAGFTVPGCYHVANPRALAHEEVRRLFAEGKVLVSDAAAQAVAACAVGDEKPGSMLEIGSGRGTKTILMQGIAQRRFGSQLDLTAVDLHDFKIDLLRERAAQYGVALREARAGNAANLDAVLDPGSYDCVFVDAPCSGLGTLRRHPEIRWRITSEAIDAMADTTYAILRAAAPFVAVGGRLVLSTCTVTYAENTGMVRRFLESPAGEGFALAPLLDGPCVATKLQKGSPDAHFAACFVRVR
ncbi:hypothetical protein HLV35_05080 [Eggerthellaceae bacterium zg-997]|nr:hypothetical protein [Eggerthellaceae bacterium zg-997]